jgi:hypothetical protein
MTRRAVCALLLAVAACGKRENAIDPFPETVAGWKRTALREIPLAEAPDPVPRANTRKILAAAYDGSGKIEARAYELTSSEIGLDIAQRWHSAPDTVFFWAQHWFVVVAWQQADRKALQDFTRALEKWINGK